MRRLPAALLTVSLAAGPALAESPAELCAAAGPRGDVRACGLAVEAAPADPALRRLYAQSLVRIADYDGAVGQYREAVRLAPQDARAQYEYAWMLAFVRRYADAVEPIEAAIRLRPDDAPTLRAAAIIYQLLKRGADQFRVVMAGARLGDEIAMFDLYECFAEGIGTAKDEAQAFLWLERAGEAGHVTAMDRLVEVYLHGRLGRAPDEAKAESWATKARLARHGKL